MKLKDYIKNVPNFPKKGINFKDISPLLEDSESLEFVINSFEVANA
jgi:adenine phosphoribosyltransferase